jgi:hypothetical protein
MNYTEEFIKAGKFAPEELFIKEHIVLENIMGSHAYGCNSSDSDFDIVVIFMDRYQDLYPQNYNLILGYDELHPIYQKEFKGPSNRIVLPNGRACEGEWKSLIKFFKLAGLGGSPHLLESLFVKRNFVSVGTDIGWMLRDNRRLFLSSKTFHSFKGYSEGQLERIRRGFNTKKSDNLLRQEYIDKWGFDCKMASHLLRLIDEIEQMLTIGDIDLMRARDEMISMRSGRWGDFARLETYCHKRIEDLEQQVLKRIIPIEPQAGKLHELLQKCIEQYYGSMDKFKGTEYVSAKEIKEQLDRIEAKLPYRLSGQTGPI